MLDTTAPPFEVNLCRQSDAMHALELARSCPRVTVKAMCDQAGITTNSFHSWTRNDRSPILWKFIAFAEAHGYAVEMTDEEGQSINLRSLGEAIERVNLRRRAMKVGVYDMELRAGVSFRSFYAWRNEQRSPTIANIVALAETFGFLVVMRRDTKSNALRGFKQ